MLCKYRLVRLQSIVIHHCFSSGVELITSTKCCASTTSSGCNQALMSRSVVALEATFNWLYGAVLHIVVLEESMKSTWQAILKYSKSAKTRWTIFLLKPQAKLNFWLVKQKANTR
jgi:hypothetical protein